MFKLAGLLCLVLGLGLAGMLKAAELKERIELLEEFRRMCLQLKGEISYFREPLPTLLRKVVKTGDSRAFSLLERVRFELDKKQGEMAQIWPSAVSEVYEKTPLEAGDLDILKYLGTFIGQTDYENQQFHFEYLEQQLAVQIADAQQIYQTRGHLYRKLGFFIGVLMAVLLM